MRGVLDSLEGLQASEVHGASITDAEIRKRDGKRKGGDKYSTVHEVGETQSHSSARCPD